MDRINGGKTYIPTFFHCVSFDTYPNELKQVATKKIDCAVWVTPGRRCRTVFSAGWVQSHPLVGHISVHLRSYVSPMFVAALPKVSLLSPRCRCCLTPHFLRENMSFHQEVLRRCPHAFQYGFAPRKRRKGQGRNFDRHGDAKAAPSI